MQLTLSKNKFIVYYIVFICLYIFFLWAYTDHDSKNQIKLKDGAIIVQLYKGWQRVHPGKSGPEPYSWATFKKDNSFIKINVKSMKTSTNHLPGKGIPLKLADIHQNEVKNENRTLSGKKRSVKSIKKKTINGFNAFQTILKKAKGEKNDYIIASIDTTQNEYISFIAYYDKNKRKKEIFKMINSITISQESLEQALALEQKGKNSWARKVLEKDIWK